VTVPACRRCGHEVTTLGPRCPYCGREECSRLDRAALFKADVAVSLFALVVCGLVLLLLALLGCSDLSGRHCTLVACSNGISVRVEGLSEADISVTSATGETRGSTCPPFEPSICVAHFPDFTPEEATIRVEAGERQLSVTTNPAYDVLQPNGPECDPTCLQATVTISLDTP